MTISPCTGVCRIDPRAGVCEGCARTLDEIAGWGSLSEAQRRAALDVLAARQQAGAPSGKTQAGAR